MMMTTISQETPPGHCLCGGGDFQISDKGARYTCEACGQQYIATLALALLSTRGGCPDCTSPLQPGPRGGCSVNMACANGHEFNVTNFGLLVIVERIDRGRKKTPWH